RAGDEDGQKGGGKGHVSPGDLRELDEKGGPRRGADEKEPDGMGHVEVEDTQEDVGEARGEDEVGRERADHSPPTPKRPEDLPHRMGEPHREHGADREGQRRPGDERGEERAHLVQDGKSPAKAQIIEMAHSKRRCSSMSSAVVRTAASPSSSRTFSMRPVNSKGSRER